MKLATFDSCNIDKRTSKQDQAIHIIFQNQGETTKSKLLKRASGTGTRQRTGQSGAKILAKIILNILKSLVNGLQTVLDSLNAHDHKGS